MPTEEISAKVDLDGTEMREQEIDGADLRRRFATLLERQVAIDKLQ